jgi:hypothetical protein
MDLNDARGPIGRFAADDDVTQPLRSALAYAVVLLGFAVTAATPPMAIYLIVRDGFV